jgi:lipoprotein-releasing system ATP-binding protein
VTLTADSLFKHYDTPRGPVPVLEDVSFRLERGEAIAITGPSGCGKSTLLYLLGALEPPTDGEVLIDGTNPYALGEKQQASFRGATVGFVFQDHLLLPQLSALDNVIAPTLVAGKGRSPAQYRERAKSLLESVGLGDRLHHRPGELSGGERQRVAVARALIRQPTLLLCDEPTGNLDRAAADGVADVLLKLHADRKTMLVVVTHSAALAARLPRRYELADHRLREA